MNILLDMDGVLVDFVSGACKAHNRTNPFDPLIEEAKGQFYIDKIWGMSDKEFWAPMESEHFWANLDWMEDGRRILELCECFADNVVLATSPTIHATSSSGKHIWINEHLPAYKRKFLIGAPKEIAASSDLILVDDSDKNIGKFAAAGGYGVLVPRPWNSLWAYCDKSYVYLRNLLEELCLG